MKRLTIGILAHVDSGKTTLSEGLLYCAGMLRKLGRVDRGDAFLDTHALEKSRGITIFSKQARLLYGDCEFTLLDTPGHVDFSAEAERTLSVLDYALLVVSGSEGIQPHTETLFKLLCRYSVPTFVFINKMDIAHLSRQELMGGLKKTRDTLFGGLFVENGEKIDDEFYEELEEAMIISDMGMATTEKLLGQLRSKLRSEGVHTRTEAKQVMISLLADCMRPEDGFLDGMNKAVILVVGVNGVGKTTSIGKLAAMYKADGRSVMLAAGDTFRAAAAEQLTIWAERADVPIVKHGEGADPAAVVFDAIASFKAKNCDILICDTAGRLHNKKNLMTELAKIRKVIGRELPDVPVEVLLVLDATTGQNAIAQAKVFGENCGLTGVVLTKLDGTAKGGVSVAVKDELGLPVRFVGVGEGIDDLQPFDADDFAKALLG